MTVAFCAASLGSDVDAENDLIVADYFATLAADVAGQPYNKAEHNRDLQARIHRNRSSIEFKLPAMSWRWPRNGVPTGA